MNCRKGEWRVQIIEYPDKIVHEIECSGERQADIDKCYKIWYCINSTLTIE
jgi:hypothetical protein